MAETVITKIVAGGGKPFYVRQGIEDVRRLVKDGAIMRGFTERRHAEDRTNFSVHNAQLMVIGPAYDYIMQVED